jgi:hypothetical protein
MFVSRTIINWQSVTETVFFFGEGGGGTADFSIYPTGKERTGMFTCQRGQEDNGT